MSYSSTGKRYFSAASMPAMAAVFFRFAANSAERALDEVSMISTRGKWFCTQLRHWARDCGCAKSFRIFARGELLNRHCCTGKTICETIFRRSEERRVGKEW